MDHYLKLRNILLTTLPSGNTNLYFQIPEDQKMSYPCIRYKLDDMDIRNANNNPYVIKKGYKLTIIDRDPLSAILGKVIMLPYTKFVTSYEADGLNHFVFTLYY